MAERIEAERLYTPREVMDLLKIRRTKMYEFLRRGDIQAARMPSPGGGGPGQGRRGANIRITGAEVIRFRKECGFPERTAR
jgi:Helix-turn-helix domain